MKIKQLIKLEDKAKEVWVVSPTLHFDIENKDFTELVSVNLGEKTKYRYIVPGSKLVKKNLKIYKKKYKLSSKEIKTNFLVLPKSEFNPFINEIAIYNGSKKCVACSAPATEDKNDVIQFNKTSSKQLARDFKSVWKKYKGVKP